MLDNCIELQ